MTFSLRSLPLHRPSFFRLALATAVVGALAATAAVAQAHFLPDALTLPGLRLDGAPVPAFATTKELRAWVEERVQALRDRPIELRAPGAAGEAGGQSVAQATLGELGVVVYVDGVTSRLVEVGHEGDMIARAGLAKRAREGAIDVPMLAAIDARTAGARLAAIKEATDIAPVSARLDLEHHGVLPEKAGRYVDTEGAIAALTRAIASGDDAITLPVAVVPPRFTSQFVSTLDVRTVIASYETYFSRHGEQARRGQNIDVAAKKLDGLVITPGEMFSFNAIVGERSEENGFQKSWEILKGEMVEGVGGGTCQVASTLHAIAFFGGLEVLERLPHSRPSAYIPMGLDATVVYPEVDMKLRNPYDFPVVVHAVVEGNRLKMELLGARKEAKVSFTRELLETRPYRRKVEEDDALTGTRVTVKQHGIRGYKIKRVRTMLFADGHMKKEEDTQRYPSTTEIYEVPPGFDEALLPPLPEADDDEGEGSDTSAAAASAAATNANAPAPAGAAGASAPPPVANANVPVPPTASATPVAPAGNATAVACVGECAKQNDVTFVDAPGAHAPTQAQARPPKRLVLRR